MSKKRDPSCDVVRATIVKVRELEGYVVAYPLTDHGDLTRNDSVTFSLSEWQGEWEPDYGQVVELIGTELYMRGWRAVCARPITPWSSKGNQQPAARSA